MLDYKRFHSYERRPLFDLNSKAVTNLYKCFHFIAYGLDKYRLLIKYLRRFSYRDMLCVREMVNGVYHYHVLFETTHRIRINTKCIPGIELNIPLPSLNVLRCIKSILSNSPFDLVPFELDPPIEDK